MGIHKWATLGNPHEIALEHHDPRIFGGNCLPDSLIGIAVSDSSRQSNLTQNTTESWPDVDSILKATIVDGNEFLVNARHSSG